MNNQSKNKYLFKIFDGRKGFNEIQNEWQYIVQGIEQKSIFHLYEWHKSLIDSMDDDYASSLFFIVVYKSDVPIGVVSLKAFEIKLWGMKWNILRIPDFLKLDHPLFDFIIDKSNHDGDLVADMVRFINLNCRFGCDLIIFSNILENSSLYTLIKKSHLKNIILEKGKDCYYFQCDTTQDLYQGFSKEFKKSYRNAKNRLQKHKKSKYVIIQDKKEILKSLEIFIEIEASGWKGMTSQKGIGEAIKLDPISMKFYYNLVKNFSNIDGCLMFFLYVEDQPIAGELNLVLDGTLYGLKCAYNEEYSRLSPSNLLLINILKVSMPLLNLKYYNTLTDANYLLRMNPMMHRGHNAYIFNNSFWGYFGLKLFRSKGLVNIYRKFVKPIFKKRDKYF